MRLRKLAIDGDKTLPGVAALAYRQSFQVWCFQRLSTALTDRPNLSLVHRRARVGPPTVGIPRAENHRAGIQARYIGEVRHRDARSPEEVEIHHEEPTPGRPRWCMMSSGRPTGAIA